MAEDPENSLPTVPAPVLAYETAEPGKRYQRVLVEPGVPIYFPNICCGCLRATPIVYTIRGNRIQASGAMIGGLVGGAAGAIVGGALGGSTHFNLQVPVCNRCWNAYQKRRKSWFWIGSAVGAGAMLLLASPLLIAVILSGDIRSVVCMATAMAGIGMAVGLILNPNLASVLAEPPAKVLLHKWSGRVAIRFRNAAYIDVFQHAQVEMPLQAAEQVRQIEAARPQPELAPPPAQWFYLENGETAGPVDFEGLYQRAAAGTLQPADQVYAEGGSEWVPAESVPGLFAAPVRPEPDSPAPPDAGA